MFSENSERNCLQAPQGNAKSFPLDAIATALNTLCFSVIALTAATLSAHMVKEYDEHSTLAPMYTVLSFVSKATPTLNFEYGEWESFLAFIDSAINSSYIV